MEEFFERNAIFFFILVKVLIDVRRKELLTVHFSDVIRFLRYVLRRLRTIDMTRLRSILFRSLSRCLRHVSLICFGVQLRLVTSIAFGWSFIVSHISNIGIAIPDPIAMAAILRGVLSSHISSRWSLLSATSKRLRRNLRIARILSSGDKRPYLYLLSFSRLLSFSYVSLYILLRLYTQVRAGVAQYKTMKT